MKALKRIAMLVIGAFCAVAYGQSQDLVGEWELMGRMCEDSKKFVPPSDSIQTLVFKDNNSFQHSYFQVPDTGGITREEAIENKRRRFREMQERDEETHEAACEKSRVEDKDTGEDLCTAQGKRKLYDKWWSSRQRNMEQEIAELLPEFEEEEGDCRMLLDGTWTARGDQLTFRESSFDSTPACGPQAGPPDRVSVRYYFEENNLYLRQPANRNSREYCGDSDWSEIYFRK